MATVPRRIKPKIKPPRKHGPDTSMSDTWNSLSRAIREIHNNNASNLSFEENYRYAYNLVLHKQGEMLYSGVKSLVAENVDRLVDREIKPAFPTGVNSDPASRSQEMERLLKAVKVVWDEHTGNMSKLRDILKYVDRVYTPSANVPLIWDTGMTIFRERVFKSPIKEHIIDAVLTQIEIEREEHSINRSAVRSCVDVFLQLHTGEGAESVYKRDLEPEILAASRKYYTDEGEKLITTCDAPEFLRRVEERFNAEDSRAHNYLSSQSVAPLQRILEDTLLSPHLSAVLTMPNSGLDTMINSNQKDSIARMFKLFTKVPAGLISFRRKLKESLLRKGQEINDAAGNDDGAKEEAQVDVKGKGKARANAAALASDVASKWVKDVLALKQQFDDIWKDSCDINRDVETTLNESFESFINRNPRAPEFISLFIDENLKKGLKGKSDQEVDETLDKTITIFRYITEKDAFERYYKAHLAKRLLNNRSVSDDAERGMLAKLKVECGFHFTQKLEGMFTDMKVSADTMDAYRQNIAKSATVLEMEISVIVMTTNSWPTSYSTATCNLPPLLLKSCKSFENFYLSRHSGRRLTWVPGLGNADVRVAFKSRTLELNVTTFALVILLLFDELGDDEFLTYEEIKQATDLPDIELKRQLQSLACAKYKVLKKHPSGREVNTDDSFSFNDGFSTPMLRIKINTVSATRVENAEERKDTQERIEEERRHQTDACIVRIMKNRKHMTHTDLINEVTRQLASRFQPVPLAIKKRIENLIERDYLERCEDRKSYNYMA